MAGELVPLVMIPRYTTYAGASDFTSIGMDVSEYESAILNIWRGRIVGVTTSPAFKVTCEESTDQNVWSTCEGTTADTLITEDEEKQFLPAMRKRWFRVRITLTGTGGSGDGPVCSCWGVGYLEERVR